MQLVRARAGFSKVSGIGVIAQEFIPAGTPTWRLKQGFDITLTPDQLEELSPAAKEQALHYGWFIDELGCLVISADDDRFTNHSETPNTHWNGDCVVASRDIQAGEELTYDYNDLDATGYEKGWGGRLPD